MLIIMFSVAHRRFQELIYISLALIAIILTLCIIFAIFNTVIKGGPLIDFWDTCSNARHSVRHRYQSNHNHLSNQYNQYNQQRVHVCAPPTMGGARLNIIYTIGEWLDRNALNCFLTWPVPTGQHNNSENNQRQSLSLPTDRHSFAINLDSNVSLDRSPRTSGAPFVGPNYLRYPPIITVVSNNGSGNYHQIISPYEDCSPTDDLINGLNLHDLPPLYHQLDVIPTDGPPTYEEAIKDKQPQQSQWEWPQSVVIGFILQDLRPIDSLLPNARTITLRPIQDVVQVISGLCQSRRSHKKKDRQSVSINETSGSVNKALLWPLISM